MLFHDKAKSPTSNTTTLCPPSTTLQQQKMPILSITCKKMKNLKLWQHSQKTEIFLLFPVCLVQGKAERYKYSILQVPIV